MTVVAVDEADGAHADADVDAESSSTMLLGADCDADDAVVCRGDRLGVHGAAAAPPSTHCSASTATDAAGDAEADGDDDDDDDDATAADGTTTAATDSLGAFLFLGGVNVTSGYCTITTTQ